MKKLAYAFAFFFLLFAGFATAQRKTDREMAGLKGNVKSVRVEWSRIIRSDGQETQGARRPESVTNYDEQGNRTDGLAYSLVNGSLEERRVYSRDADGNQTVIAYGPNGALLSKSVATFNQAGRPTEWVTYDANGAVVRKAVTEYYADGRLSQGIMYNGDGSLSNKTIYLYDPQGKYLGYEVRDASGNIMMKVMQSADSYEVFHYDNEGTVDHRSTAQAPTYEYDSQGNWIKESTRSSQTHAGRTEEVIQLRYRTITYY